MHATSIASIQQFHFNYLIASRILHGLAAVMHACVQGVKWISRGAFSEMQQKVSFIWGTCMANRWVNEMTQIQSTTPPQIRNHNSVLSLAPAMKSSRENSFRNYRMSNQISVTDAHKWLSITFLHTNEVDYSNRE